jgi:hypothetical protein
LIIQYFATFVLLSLAICLATIVGTCALQEVHTVRMERARAKVAERESWEEQEKRTPLIGIDIERSTPPDMTLMPVISFFKSPLNGNAEGMERLREQIIQGFSDVMKRGEFVKLVEQAMHQEFLNKVVRTPYSERGN